LQLRFAKPSSVVALSVVAVALASGGCGEPAGRWSGTDWWTIYAALPEWEMTPVSAGALDATTQPFPGARQVAVSSSGRIAIVQEGIPAVWVYDDRGRSLGRVGRSEIMDVRGPDRTRIWAERAGWLSGDRLWISERGGSIAIFNREMSFSDVWDVPGEGDPLVIVEGARGMSALVLGAGDGVRTLTRVHRGGAGEALAELPNSDTLVACPDGSCFVVLELAADTLGLNVTIETDGGRGAGFRLPRAPDGARPPPDGSPPRAANRILVDRNRRTWLGLAEDDSGRAYWLILDPSGAPIGRFDLASGQAGLLAADGVFWARREADGVTWLHRYSYRPPAPVGPTAGGS